MKEYDFAYAVGSAQHKRYVRDGLLTGGYIAFHLNSEFSDFGDTDDEIAALTGVWSETHQAYARDICSYPAGKRVNAMGPWYVVEDTVFDFVLDVVRRRDVLAHLHVVYLPSYSEEW